MSFPKLLCEGYKKNSELNDLEELHHWIRNEKDSSTLSFNPQEHLSSLLLNDTYLNSSSKKTRLLTASCLAHILRLCMPSHPFTELQKLETCLLFILGQLAQALQSFDFEERQIAINFLQCVVSTKVFRLCFLVEKGQQLLTSLLSLMMPIAEKAFLDEPFLNERQLIIKLIRGIIEDSQTMIDFKVVMPLAETIVIGPKASLARALVAQGGGRYSGEMIGKLHIWLLEKSELKEQGGDLVPNAVQGLKVFNLTWELLTINKALVTPAYHVLASKLTSIDEEFRTESLKIVKTILLLDEADVEHPLWSSVLNRFTDTSSAIRVLCVHAVCELSQLRASLLCELAPVLDDCTKDPENCVRSEVAYVCTHIILLGHGDNNMELLLTLEKLANDKECQVRAEAVKGMSRVYKQHLSNHSQLSTSQRDSAHLIFRSVVNHFFPVSTFVSKLVTEKLLNNFLIPFSLPVRTKMEKLVFFLSEATRSCISAFQALQEEIVNSRNNPVYTDSEYMMDACFAYTMQQFDPAILCRGLLTKECMQILMQLVGECISAPLQASKYGLDPTTVRDKMRNVGKALSSPHTDLVCSSEILGPITELLSGNIDTVEAAWNFLASLTSRKPLGEVDSLLSKQLMLLCENCLFRSTDVQPTLGLVKAVVHFLRGNITHETQQTILNIFQLTRVELENASGARRAVYISLLGYLAAWIPSEQRANLRAVIARKVVKEVLMKPCASNNLITPKKFWYPNIQISTGVFCKVQAVRTMARWIFHAQSDDCTTIGNTLRMMDAFLSTKGDLVDNENLSEVEKAVLRLEAGACILKILRIKDAFQQLTASHLHNLATLCMDESVEVIAQFSAKLYKGLCLQSLPFYFTSFFVLRVLDPSPELQQNTAQHIESILSTMDSSILPEYSLLWSLPLLASTPHCWLLPSVCERREGAWPLQSGITAFTRIRFALWSLIWPMIKHKGNVLITRLQRIVQLIKNCSDAVPTDLHSNQRLWVTCDIAFNLIDTYQKSLTRKVVREAETLELMRPTLGGDLKLLTESSDPHFNNAMCYANIMFGPLPQLPNFGKLEVETQSGTPEEEQEDSQLSVTFM